MEASDDAGDSTSLQEYSLPHYFTPGFAVQVGRYKGAFGKQENTMDDSQMFIDRSIANEVFNIGRCAGLEVFGRLNASDNPFGYRFGLYNDLRDVESRPFLENDNTPAAAGRIIFQSYGTNTTDFTNESDLEYHENAVAQLGLSFAYADDRDEGNFDRGDSRNYKVLVRSGDGRPNVLWLAGQTTLFGFDASYKHQGLSVAFESFFQHTNIDQEHIFFSHDFGSTRDVFSVQGENIDNQGWHAQAGYFIFPKYFELIGRMGAIYVDDLKNDCYEWAFGCNWYLSGQQLKLSTDVSMLDDLPIVSPEANYNGIQTQSLLMVRCQLQFQF